LQYPPRFAVQDIQLPCGITAEGPDRATRATFAEAGLHRLVLGHIVGLAIAQAERPDLAAHEVGEDVAIAQPRHVLALVQLAAGDRGDGAVAVDPDRRLEAALAVLSIGKLRRVVGPVAAGAELATAFHHVPAVILAA